MTTKTFEDIIKKKNELTKQKKITNDELITKINNKQNEYFNQLKEQITYTQIKSEIYTINEEEQNYIDKLKLYNNIFEEYLINNKLKNFQKILNNILSTNDIKDITINKDYIKIFLNNNNLSYHEHLK